MHSELSKGSTFKVFIPALTNQAADRRLHLAWRPIREPATDAHFLYTIAALGAPNILRIEVDVGAAPAGAHGQRPLSRAGLLIVNPPHALFDEARLLAPWLAALLARDGRGAHLCEWLTPPK